MAAGSSAEADPPAIGREKSMKYLCLAAVLLIVSCDEPRHPRLSGPQGRPADLPPPPYEETGPELVEKGKVLEVAFRLGSATTTTTTSPGYNKTIAQSAWDDPWGMHSKRVEVPATNSASTVVVEDQFAVVFECDHKVKFIIESLGKESKAGLLWKKLKQGDTVDIRYKEVIKVIPTPEKISETRKVIRYEFIDADPVR